MKKQKWKSTTLAGLTVALSATLLSAAPAQASDSALLAADAAYSPFYGSQGESSVHVHFQDLTVWLPQPPKLRNGTMMVPARALLEGLGYRLQWNAESRRLDAAHSSRPALAFRDGFKEAELGGQPASDLPEAPFVDNGLLWIPLRGAAEAARLAVSWDERNRLAIVADPYALPRISVMTAAANDVYDTPDALLDYSQQFMKANVQLDLVGPEHYHEKTMVMIASGDLRSLLLLKNPYTLQDEILSSIAVSPDEHLNAFPRLKELAANGPGTRRIDGQAILIPRLSDPHHASFPAIRQDWLELLGLAEPTTMDELYAVLKQFVQSDPDANGKEDTWGLIGYTGGSGLGSLSWVEHAFTGNPERFSVQDGRVVDHAATAEQTRALRWLSDAYREGILHPEFAVMNKEQAGKQLAEHKAGLAAMSIEEAAGLTVDQEAVWLPLSTVRADADSEPVAPWNTQGDGAYLLSVMARQTPTQLLEWLNHGIEMTERDGWKELEGWTEIDQSAVDSLFGRPDMLRRNRELEHLAAAVREQYEAAVQQWRTVSYEDALLPEADALWSTGKYAALHNELLQAKIKVIMGAMSFEQWESFVKEHRQSPLYQEMMANLNALAAQRSK